MKTAPLLAIALTSLIALPLQASQTTSGFMPFSSPNSLAAEDSNGSAVLLSTLPLTSSTVTTNTTMQLWSGSGYPQVISPDAIIPVTNGPAGPAPVPESGSGLMFLSLAAAAMFALRLRLRFN